MRTIGRAGRELDKIGPAIVVTHSQSGLFGWLLATRRPSLVKAVISYEPGFVFPEGAVPPTAAGGLWRQHPRHAHSGSGRRRGRAQVVASVVFQGPVNSRGGDAEILHLPDAGLFGNSHFSYSDLNNLEVADRLSLFLHQKGLDRRKP